MKNSTAIKEALAYAQTLCSKKEMYIQGIIDKLKRFELSDNDTQTIIKKLLEDNFIDEQRFATCFARDKHKFNKWGKRKIEFELKYKKIPGNIITDAIEQIDEELYLANLSDILTKKHRSIKDTDPFIIKHKLYAHASNKGYLHDEINTIMSQII